MAARPPVARSRFEIRGRVRVPDLDAELMRFIHRPTGARHLHLDLPVEDCAFLMGFLTPAPDSSGLTHVLEHLVLCGSERYPCRRAFFAMLGRTLSTTMNALTTEDCTAYHFATRSLADFENLLSVYLDAAFFPRLDRLDFDQEAYRVEIEDAGEGRAAPVRRGVVLSEMRGLMNDPEHQLRQALSRCLFPAAPYRFDAGGDPWEIPTLDYETLRAYHRRHYHPGNAVFLSAGPLPPAWVQARLEELALARLSRREPGAASPLASIIHVPPIERPAWSVVRYPVTCSEDREPPGASVALAWRLGETSDPVAEARARLLARCLLDQGDAPLRGALLDAPGSAGPGSAGPGSAGPGSAGPGSTGPGSTGPGSAGPGSTGPGSTGPGSAGPGSTGPGSTGPGSAGPGSAGPGSAGVVLASNGVQATRRRLVFQCGVHGCDPDTAGEIESRVLAAIGDVARDGLDPSLVDGALAQMERGLRERHDRRYPFALKLLVRMLPAALYGGDPAAVADVSPALATLRAETGSREEVGALVRRWLHDNPERASVIAIPDPAAGRRLEADDRARLVRAYGPSRRQARSRILERSRALRRRQASVAGESSLPRLDLDAIGPPREPPELFEVPAADLPEAYRRSPPGEPRSSPEESRSPPGEPRSSPGESRSSPGKPRSSPGESRSPPGESRPSPGEPGTKRMAGAPGRRPAPDRHDSGGSTQAGRPAELAGPVSVRVSRGPTGRLVYARLAIDLSGFDPDQLDDLGLLADILPESAHGRLASGETRARIARVCDRLSVEPRLLARNAPGAGGSGAAAPRAVLLLSARARSCDEAALHEVLADAKLDARFDRGARAAAATARARRSRELTRNGHLHAERVAAACLDSWHAVSERWQGPSALAILARVLEGDDASGSLVERLQRAHRALAAAPYRLQIVRDREDGPTVTSDTARNDRSPGAPPAKDGASSSSDEPRGAGREGREGSVGHGGPRRVSEAAAWVVDSPVSYCARVFPAVAASHPDAGPLSVLAAFLGGDRLSRAIRERGGAYGAGARYCDRTATLRMFSYRDPRLAETLRDFEREIEALRREPPEGRGLEEAILRAVRDLDRPRAFQVAARERFLDEMQGRGAQAAASLRASVLRTEPEQLREVAERYLRPELGATGVLAGTGREGDLDRLGIAWRRL